MPVRVDGLGTCVSVYGACWIEKTRRLADDGEWEEAALERRARDLARLHWTVSSRLDQTDLAIHTQVH